MSTYKFIFFSSLKAFIFFYFLIWKDSNMINGETRYSVFSPKNKIRPLSLIPIEEIVEKKKKVSEKVEELNRKQFEFKNCFIESKLISLKQFEGSQFDLISLSPNKRDFALFNVLKEDESKVEGEEGTRNENEGKSKEEKRKRKWEEGVKRNEEEWKKEEEEGGFTLAIKNLEEL